MENKIKIQDLSVGDWVCAVEKVGVHGNPYHTPPMKIVALGEGWVQTRIDPEQGDPFEYTPDEIRGIPLSGEIFEKNGFECIAVGDKGPATPRQNYMRYEKWRVETQRGYRDLFFDRITKRYRLDGMNGYSFAEVHKLQHALRFSNFDKEIEL